MTLLLQVEAQWPPLTTEITNDILREANYRCGRSYEDSNDRIILFVRASMLRKLYFYQEYKTWLVRS